MNLNSVVLVPAGNTASLKEVLNWGSDALCLDLQGLVHPGKRTQVRASVKDDLNNLDGDQSLLLARINLEEMETDLKAVVWPKLGGVVVPGVEDPEVVKRLDRDIAALERERNIPAGNVRIIPFLDSGKGLWFAQSIATASPRVVAIVLGMGDLLFDLLRTSEDYPYFTGPVPRFPVPDYIWSRLAFISSVSKVQLLGLLGTTVIPGKARSQDLNKAAGLARQAGFHGAFVLDRSGVEACRQGFSVPEAVRRMAQDILDKQAQGQPVTNGQLRLAGVLLEPAAVSKKGLGGSKL